MRPPTTFFVLLTAAAASWVAGILTVQHWALTIPSVLLLGWCFNLDAAETLRRGREVIIRHERAPVLSLIARIDVRLAFLAQGLVEGALIGWLVPLLLGPDLWFYLIPGVAVFMSATHVYGWRCNAMTYTTSRPDQTTV